jgi:hypothetical protein
MDPAQPFVPADFTVPELLETPHFRLRPLGPANVDQDYAAVMESAALLQAMFGRGWPAHDFSREQNLADLVEHAEEFARREAFAYTVTDPAEVSCLGCVYINPPRGHPTEARVYLWVRQSAYDRGLDPLLFAAVRDWLAAEWPFGQVLFPGRDADGGWRPLEGKAV